MKGRITAGIAAGLLAAAFIAPAAQAVELSEGPAIATITSAEVITAPGISTEGLYLESVVGRDYHVTIPVTGSPATSVEVVDGALPAGLTASLAGNGTELVLSGTATQAGIHFFSLRVSNAAGSAVSEPLVMLVFPSAPWLDPFNI